MTFYWLMATAQIRQWLEDLGRIEMTRARRIELTRLEHQ